MAMSEFDPTSAETIFEPVVPITELVTDISERDANLITDIAALDQKYENISHELSGLMPWALDRAFMRPHRTAQMLRDAGRPKLHTEALSHAQVVQRSGIAYTVSANPKISWMSRVTDNTYAVLREDRIFSERRDKYSGEPNAPWLYQHMQSRLLLCLARMMEGKEMQVRKIHPTIRQKIAEEVLQLLKDSDGV